MGERQLPHIAPRAKSVIYLHMSGAPPSLDLFDWKPKLAELHLQPCPESLLEGKRFAFIKGVPRLLGSPYRFERHGQAGAWVSEVLPHFAAIADDVTIVKSMSTNQFNHAPAELFMYTGSPNPGNASMGSWVTYGLGNENRDVPGFVVLLSGGTDPTGARASGEAGFSPRCIRGCNAVRLGNRFFTRIIRRGWTAAAVGERSTRSRSLMRSRRVISGIRRR